MVARSKIGLQSVDPLDLTKSTVDLRFLYIAERQEHVAQSMKIIQRYRLLPILQGTLQDLGIATLLHGPLCKVGEPDESARLSVLGIKGQRGLKQLPCTEILSLGHTYQLVPPTQRGGLCFDIFRRFADKESLLS